MATKGQEIKISELISYVILILKQRLGEKKSKKLYTTETIVPILLSDYGVLSNEAEVSRIVSACRRTIKTGPKIPLSPRTLELTSEGQIFAELLREIQFYD